MSQALNGLEIFFTNTYILAYDDGLGANVRSTLQASTVAFKCRVTLRTRACGMPARMNAKDTGEISD